MSNCLILISILFLSGCSSFMDKDYYIDNAYDNAVIMTSIDNDTELRVTSSFDAVDIEPLPIIKIVSPRAKKRPVINTSQEIYDHKFFAKEEFVIEDYDDYEDYETSAYLNKQLFDYETSAYLQNRKFHTGDPLFSTVIKSSNLIPQITRLPEKEAQAMVCMALNVYHEARGSTVQDQMSTSYIVLNRMQDPSFPLTVCDVVWEYTTMKSGKKIAQFSWTRDGASDIPKTKSSWELAQKIAYVVIKDSSLINLVGDRLNYFAHNSILPPSWARHAYDPVIIGAHTYLTATKQRYCMSCGLASN